MSAVSWNSCTQNTLASHPKWGTDHQARPTGQPARGCLVVQLSPSTNFNLASAAFLRAMVSEAGLNDGLSFPFVQLAVALALATQAGKPWLQNWLLFDVLWRLGAGVGLGWLTGKLLGILTFRLPKRAKLARTGDGFVALGITCLSYGLIEMAHGYGFVGVFVTALTLSRLSGVATITQTFTILPSRLNGF